MARTLLITGGASGIGAETARRAAARGYRIAINYRSREAQAKAIVAEIEAGGGEAIAIPADMAREAEIVRLFDETEKSLGPITHLVNSAGINGRRGRVEDYDAAALAEVFAVNVVGLMLCCREAGRRMSTRRGGKGGAIVNVSSMAATLGGRSGSSAYAATKGAVDAFTKGFAREVASEGVRVNSIRPGMVLSEMTEGRLSDKAFRSGIEASIPMRRVGETHEIAEAILWLLSDEASFITGAMLDAAGGGYII
ncbi:SDR family oxidoreductase [Enhydrobacter sp.]|jgi:NAD(P)-dependent dehydrogenase (short-subunit alcohol dehydrogenase family)|uniref:SDR family oxidoreductase n=1 Tax=Enhydrobacter sp. TaxID=1894999 RepID=UPI00261FAC34|nr:SDR family oxidoreductase [Enhydrobacter sp.]WIM11737.1 MAG: Oxidoreductase, short-chain dehydrogenase/reductase family [Enhydrobacter sp.]